MAIPKQTLDLLHQCDDWRGWMAVWVCEAFDELLFYAPDNELLVCIPVPETLADAVQFVNHIGTQSIKWQREQDEAQPTPFNPK